jgi:hypothetical protein
LQEDEYKDIVDSPNQYFAVVYGSPENTFVFPKEVVATFFSGNPFASREGEKPKWYFDIHEDNGNYYLKVHSAGAKEQKIDNYLNKWDQIEDLKPFYDGSYRAGSPNYWVLVVTDRLEQNLTAEQILTTRLNDRFWGLNARTPSRTLLRKDDKVIFSYGAKEFLGTATLDSDSFELREEQKSQFSHDTDFFKADFGIRLKNMELWGDPKSVQKSIDVLSFIKNKKHYMAYFQGGVRKISADDYNNIINIPQSKSSLLSFVDLQKFLLSDIRMQANYQPIMIRTLLVSGGKTTKDDIAAKIKELNSDDQERDFKNIPVYEVLEKHGIVKREKNEFILNIIELTGEQRQQLIALCNWKINNMPLQIEELIQAFNKNRTLRLSQGSA